MYLRIQIKSNYAVENGKLKIEISQNFKVDRHMICDLTLTTSIECIRSNQTIQCNYTPYGYRYIYIQKSGSTYGTLFKMKMCQKHNPNPIQSNPMSVVELCRKYSQIENWGSLHGRLMTLLCVNVFSFSIDTTLFL